MVRRRLDGLFHSTNNDNLGVTSTFATPGLTDSLSFDSTEDNHKDSPITSTETVAFEGRHCDCADHLPGDKDYYCPEFTDHCQVWTSYNRDYRVSCYNESWKVYYSRYIWYYLVFWFTLLGAALFLSGPGQNAIKYLLSKCFPRMNVWITDQILLMETDWRTRLEEEITYAMHLNRRTEGWVSGYKLKTKLYSEPRHDNSDEEAREQHSNDSKSVDDIDHMCTICLLEIERGDRIADVKCGHCYHAECLSEWILKREPNVAEELRSFETDEDFTPSRRENSNSQPFRTRLKRRWNAMLLNIATGRRGEDHRHNINHPLLFRD
ncbi:predicted protein [Thalassiosira pseudonana CCMP1335]|uniref:RING-type domain-containing protein n=1 Tax=Thalassiosira pseudonana TaxID=35128 RepID=B8CA68_THAPS|nr:predicted protein [Thalassiosira pseudonana CCMP1335]EED89453.1 predicted protein [Thalassiosira pseudonana CCMP1335]